MEEFESPDGNTSVHYVGCWVDANDNQGPISEVVTSTVTC